VNKGSACEFIRRDLSIEKKFTGAIGNDWNDIHMLEWAGTAFVVGNAPDELTGRFMPVASNDNEGVSAAVTIWMGIVA
jgi:hydroxymethylpyrimidine pyrophosphatase-like HAD family hydrolase